MLQAGMQVAEANVVTVIGMVDVEWTVATANLARTMHRAS
ncbi:hypothetical protein PMI09_00573 [Rhizobium sp. CF122]|nr:hypothetical protein PMI09_00573 [Rhizobium sp. CF122]